MATTCIIDRNEKNKVRSVRTLSGQKSTLFDKIASIPLMENRERALSVFKIVYSSKFKKLFGDWTKNTPINRKAYNKIRKNLDRVAPEYRDAVLLKASKMDNPIIVSRVNTSENTQIYGLSYYSDTNLEDGNIFLVDALSPSEIVVDSSKIPDGMTVEEYQKELIENDFAPVIFLTEAKGDKSIIIRDGLALNTPESLGKGYSNPGITYSSGEPRLFFVTDKGEMFEDYGKALRSSNGTEIRAGFIAGTLQDVTDPRVGTASASFFSGIYQLNDEKAFIPIMSLPTNTNIATRHGMINYLIKKGYLSGSKVYDAETNQYYYMGEGYTGQRCLFNSASAYFELSNIFGTSNISMNEKGQILIANPDPNVVQVIDENGKRSKITKEEIKNQLKAGKYNELEARYQHFDALVLSLILEDRSIYSDNVRSLISNAKKEDLRQRTAIVDILSSLGVRVVGMTDYIDKYKTKYGYEPSARALADIANNVIAVSEDATLNDILEETSHFLVESYKDQDAIRSVLNEVEGTQEWNTHARQYYDVYGKTLQGEELDEAVHREILGKIITNNFRSAFTNTSDSFLGRVGNILRSMMNSIRGALTSQKSDLNKIVEEIKSSALSDNLSSFDTSLLKDNTFTLYSLTEKEQNKFLQDRIRELRVILRNLRQLGADRGVSTDMSLNQLRLIEDKIKDTEKTIDKNELILSLNSMVSTAEAQTNYIKEMTKDILSKKSGYDKLHLNVSDRQNIQIVNNQTLPLVRQIRGFINNRSTLDNNIKQTYIDRIDKIIADINGVQSDVDSVMDTDKNTLVTSIMDQLHVPEKVRGTILDMFDKVQEDIGWLSRWFGILEHSSSIVNNALGGLVAANNYNSMERTQALVNDFLAEVKKNGWSKSKFETLLQQVDGKVSKYLRSSINMAKFDKEYKIQQMKAFAAIIPELNNLTESEIESIVDKDKPFKVTMTVERNGELVKREVKIKPSADRVNLDILSVEQEQRYQSIMSDWLDRNTEQPFKESFRKELDKIYASAEASLGRPISQSTKEFLNNISRQKYMLKRPFYDQNGKFDDVAFAKSSNYDEFMRLQKQRKEAASPYIYIGTETIRLKKDGDSLQMAEDLQAIDNAWKEKLGSRVSSNRLTPEFLSTLNAIQMGEGGSSDAFIFVTQGGHLSFSQSYWDSMADDQTGTTASNNVAAYESLGKAIIDSSVGLREKEYTQTIIKTIADNKQIIKDILRLNRDSSNIGEIAYASMTAAEVESIRICSERIERAYMEMFDMAKQIGIKTKDYLRRSTTTENEVNETYLNELADSGMEEWQFACKHMTSKKAEKIKDFQRKMKNIFNENFVFNISESDFLAKEFDVDPTLPKKMFVKEVAYKLAETSVEQRNEIVGKFARGYLLPYFKRMAPVGYTDMLEKIKNNEINITTMIEDIQNGTSSQDYGMDISYLQFDANRQWLEEDGTEENGKNPNYRTNHGYGRYLPKKELYTDNEYLSHFGIQTASDGTERATRNIDEWNMIQRLKDIKSQSLELYGERGGNIYSIPQISTQSIERLGNLGTNPRGVLKNFVSDIVMNRVDESLYGNTRNDDGSDPEDRPKIMPKYYIYELENQDDISHDLAYSYSMLMSQSVLYDEKSKTIEKAMGLQQVLLNMQFNKGKKPESTYTYEMFNDFLNDHYFGIRANTKRMVWNLGGYDIDVTKIMMGAERFMSTMNLALSPFVAATGALTGQVNFFIESAVGQYLSKDSVAYAYKELARLAPSYINEIGDIDRKSKLYVIGERLGVFNMRNRLHGAGYNRVLRTLTRDPMYKLMEILNSPLDPQVMIASLDNVRFYNGQFYTFHEFKNMMEEKGNINIRDIWNTLRDQSLWNSIDVVDGKVVAKPNMGITEKDILDKLAVTRNQIKSLMQICNGSLNEENRIGATRNWMMRFMTAHRGWLVLATQRLWKSKGFNFQTMQMEEGLCVTLVNMLKKSHGILSEQGMGNFIDAWKAESKNLSDYEKVNLKRAAVYMATFLIMQAISAALFGWRDDDDSEDSWLSQFVTYVGMRTINEIASQMPGILELNIVDIINDPFVMARKLKDITNLDNYSMDKVTSGAYEGETKLWRLLSKQTFLKQWYNIKTPEDIKRASDWWLQTNRQSMMFFWGADRRKNEGDDDTSFK